MRDDAEQTVLALVYDLHSSSHFLLTLPSVVWPSRSHPLLWRQSRMGVSMEFTFPWPTTDGEWLAWSSAAATAFFGLVALFAPRVTFRIMRLQPAPDHPEAVAEARAASGFYLGLGLCCILLGPQLFLYMALGFSWLLTAFGRVVSMMSDGGNTLYNWLSTLIGLALAALPLGYAFGVLP